MHVIMVVLIHHLTLVSPRSRGPIALEDHLVDPLKDSISIPTQAPPHSELIQLMDVIHDIDIHVINKLISGGH